MNYKNSYLPLISILSLLVIYCSSCNNSDNPAIPNNYPNIVDSNYFDWAFDTMSVTPMKDMYIADTNKVFIPGLQYSVYIHNGTIQYIDHNDPDFGNSCVNGTNANNVYFGGISNEYSRPKLKLWNGNLITDIQMPQDTNRITRIETISDNDIWISTDRNIIYHYYNQSIISYKLNSGLGDGIVFKDKNNNVFAHFIKYTSGTYNYLYIFKFVDDSWLQINKDSINDNTDIDNFIGFSDNYILYSGNNCIHYFNGTGWDKYINTGTISNILNAGGGSRENIMFRAVNGLHNYAFYYDGKTIYKMSYLVFPYIVFSNIQYKYGRFYLTTGDDLGHSYFGVGTFKRQSK